MKKIIVAIDGVSGSGKSTTAQAVARRLGYTYVDSGAMYRAVTLYFLEHHVDFTNKDEVAAALDEIKISFRISPENQRNEIYLNSQNASQKIRTMEVSEKVSAVSAIPEVRHEMLTKQRELGKNKGIVMDGRDIGTAVLPEAELKVFMTADVAVRARRRKLDFENAHQLVNVRDIENNLRDRDQKDTTRKTNPLKKAIDAYEIDTSEITLEEQIQKVVDFAQEIIDSQY